MNSFETLVVENTNMFKSDIVTVAFYKDFWVEPKDGWEQNQEIKHFKNFEDISLGYQYVQHLAQNIPGFPFQDTPAWHPNQSKLLTAKNKKKLTGLATMRISFC